MNLDTITAAAETVIGRAPIYLFTSDQLAADLSPGDMLAYTTPDLDLLLPPELVNRGRGPVCVFSPAEIEKHATGMVANNPALDHATIAENKLLGLVAHELAHVVDLDEFPDPLAEVPPAPSIDAHRVVIAAALKAPPPQPVAGLCDWMTHSARWARIAFHLAHRLGPALGRQFLPSMCMANYGLQHEVRYGMAIDSELDALVNVPVIELRNHRPPEAFCALWESDLRRWFDSLEQPTIGHADAFCAGLELFKAQEQPC